MKEYSTFLKDPALEPYHQMVQGHIQDTLCGVGDLTSLQRFYSSKQDKGYKYNLMVEYNKCTKTILRTHVNIHFLRVQIHSRACQSASQSLWS